ncbi:hypothetical protein [Pseudomonas sp. PS01299]|uniref:hypothetical protein n=1 Tax=Pseudomonas sp. PS01299 TaxID=2991435 RepID=UPI002499D0F0|nr:hypothetical protein [Pseudomonas sp. PS01299]
MGEIDWSPVVESLAKANWTAIVVALVSGVVAIKAPLLLWKRQSERESASVKAALFAEVSALVEIVERRGFIDALRERQATLASRQASAQRTSDVAPEFYEVLIDNQFNRVYQANLTRFGVLTVEEAGQLVRFHQFADSVRLDVIPGGGLAVGTNNPDLFQEAADLLQTAMEIGYSLTAANAGASRK